MLNYLVMVLIIVFIFCVVGGFFVLKVRLIGLNSFDRDLERYAFLNFVRVFRKVFLELYSVILDKY